jgi:hypothetical protein
MNTPVKGGCGVRYENEKASYATSIDALAELKISAFISGHAVISAYNLAIKLSPNVHGLHVDSKSNLQVYVVHIYDKNAFFTAPYPIRNETNFTNVRGKTHAIASYSRNNRDVAIRN